MFEKREERIFKRVATQPVSEWPSTRQYEQLARAIWYQ